ncbi:hypothetical protein [Carbonactinospora thermoautotrophica]|uniref:hypothetical protein n=1 Tax=Carbonactinospora thermoautotrophica TaxID=1469144 RepID=UPI001A7E04AE|nr:hypothetical protein [Carbonactinospora thermoautotrophica]
MARLSPAQGAVIAAEILGVLEARHAAGRVHGRLRAEDIHIGPGGEVRVLGDTPAAQDDEARRADLEAAVALVGQLAAATSSRGRHAAASQSHLLALLERLAAGNPLIVTGVGQPAAELRAALGGPEGAERARGELGALAATLLGMRPAPPPSSDPVPPVPAEEAVEEAARPPRRLSQTLRAAWPWLWRVAVAVTVFATAVWLEYAFLREEITRSLQLLRRPEATASARPGTTGRPPSPVPVLAAASAGPLTAVDARPLQRCAPGKPCPIRVLVRARPGTKPLRVGWSFEIIDRCTGARVSRPGGEVTLKPGSDHAIALNRLQLPNGRAIAVIVITNTPARVAGPPLPFPATGGTC